MQGKRERRQDKRGRRGRGIKVGGAGGEEIATGGLEIRDKKQGNKESRRKLRDRGKKL
jgi:hypothetical protein